MTILFTASKYGNKTQFANIISEIESLGHIVKTQKSLGELSKRSKPTNKFKRDLEICDFMVAESSSTSISLGLEIATAIAKNKHVLVLCADKKSMDDLSDFVEENSSRYLHVMTYTPDTLAKTLTDCIKKIKKQLNYVLYVELSNKYGEIIDNIQASTNKSKKQIIEEALSHLAESQKKG